MGYQYGATHRNDPRTALRTVAQSVHAAKEQLAWLDQQIAAATQELADIQRKAAKARREHSAYMRDRAADPERTRSDAQRAYKLAMACNPDDKKRGPQRRRVLEREVILHAREHGSQA